MIYCQHFTQKVNELASAFQSYFVGNLSFKRCHFSLVPLLFWSADWQLHRSAIVLHHKPKGQRNSRQTLRGIISSAVNVSRKRCFSIADRRSEVAIVLVEPYIT